MASNKAKSKPTPPPVPDLNANTTTIANAIASVGPLYVAALYPQDIEETFQAMIEYTPWFIAHCDEAKLQPHEIASVWDEFCTIGDSNESDALDDFSRALTEKGYIILTSAVLSDERRNYGYLTVDLDDIEGELDDDDDDEDFDDEDEDE